MEYWKAEGDDQRACLLNELFNMAEAAEAMAQPDTRVSDDVAETLPTSEYKNEIVDTPSGQIQS